MHVLAINGSPRKDKNTATLLKSALDGAKSQGAKVKLVHLCDIKFKGCSSCFECKKINGVSYGQCSKQDGLKPVLDSIKETDALILGSPVYFSSVTGMMRGFLERLLYPYYVYETPRSSLYPKKIPTALIISMNLCEESAKQLLYNKIFGDLTHFMEIVFGQSELVQVYNTYQFEDYSRYYAPAFPQETKEKQLKERFPSDCQKAFVLGKQICHQFDLFQRGMIG